MLGGGSLRRRPSDQIRDCGIGLQQHNDLCRAFHNLAIVGLPAFYLIFRILNRAPFAPIAEKESAIANLVERVRHSARAPPRWLDNRDCGFIFPNCGGGRVVPQLLAHSALRS